MIRVYFWLFKKMCCEKLNWPIYSSTSCLYCALAFFACFVFYFLGWSDWKQGKTTILPKYISILYNLVDSFFITIYPCDINKFNILRNPSFQLISPFPSESFHTVLFAADIVKPQHHDTWWERSLQCGGYGGSNNTGPGDIWLVRIQIC